MSFLLFVIGFILGWMALRALVNFKMRRMLDSIANSPLPKEDAKVVNIDLVKMKHAIFAYDRETQMFLAQGNTKEEIVDILHKRFPGTSFMANSKNVEEVGL
jgi:hypothetical protein